jgi:hypothetical protein
VWTRTVRVRTHAGAGTRLVAQGVLQQGPRDSAIMRHLSRRELSNLFKERWVFILSYNA